MTTACYPISRPVRATSPTILQEPVSLAEAQHQCGVARDTDYHNAYLERLIVAAREQVEHDTGLVCYTGSFTWKQTYFPGGTVLELPDIRPVTAITSIAYIDSNGDSQTWSSSEYALQTSGVTQYVALAYGETWPTVRGDINGITVTLVAGYATVLAVPQRVKQAVLLALHANWYRGNEQLVEAERQQDGYERLIASLQRGTYP